ncbi:MAG: 3-oxoacyl-[acyl-carrier-protein] synthase 2 [Isosphaeraceae bacterium]|jgi:3-oxoacyl-[acyl-carrier-protein] synthase II|nr:MAG: 3-oxoacyl-[acyl-carrier-protein] synthase 2 [Isosphaeraceae bacterium]
MSRLSLPDDPDDPIVVTGLGLVCGLGTDVASSWPALLRGVSALGPLPALDPREEAITYGSRAPLACDDQTERTEQLAVVAAGEAVRQAQALVDSTYPPRLFDPESTAILIGTSKGGLATLRRFHVNPPQPPSPASAPPFWTSGSPSCAADAVRRHLGTTGPCLAPVAACATGVAAVLQAARLIRSGHCRAALAGAADAGLDPLVLGCFRSMKALARVNGDPTRAIRPWDRRRSGFLVGEGAAVLFLERASDARRRHASPIAVLAGGLLAADSFHLTDLNPDPAPYARQIRAALEQARVPPQSIDHVNLHATATRVNDPLECQALRLALGRHAEAVSCSGNKPQIGHMLGAAGAAELVFTCLALRDQIAPPTLNLDQPDPLCDLDATPHHARPRPIHAALKLSLGFGGHVAIAVLRRPSFSR